MMNKLELISESIGLEIDDIEQSVVDGHVKKNYTDKFNGYISNLRTYNDDLYCFMENLTVNENTIKDLEDKIDILEELLRNHLSHNDILYVRLKYNIKIDE